MDKGTAPNLANLNLIHGVYLVKESTDSHKLFSGLHIHAMPCTYSICININKIFKDDFFKKEKNLRELIELLLSLLIRIQREISSANTISIFLIFAASGNTV